MRNSLRLTTSSVFLLSVLAVLLAHETSRAQIQPVAPSPSLQTGDAQRSRVFSTRAANEGPRQMLWRSGKLFQYRESNTTRADAGAFTLLVDVPTFQEFTTPIISRGIVFFTFNVGDAFNAYLYAIDALTGKELIVLKFEKNSLSPPSALGSTVFFGDRNGVHAFDLEKRKEKWAFELKGKSFSSSVPVIDNGMVYAYGSGAGLYAFDAETGEVKWKLAAKDYSDEPAIKGVNLVLFGPKGMLVALDKTTGAKKWEAKAGDVASAPAILDDSIFLMMPGGEIRAHSLNDGSFRWKAKHYGGSRTPLVLYQGMVFYGARENSLVALDANTGVDKWRFKTVLPCHYLIIAGDLLYATCEDRNLYAIEPQTGQVRWTYTNRKTMLPPPVFFDGVMYMLGTDGILTAQK